MECPIMVVKFDNLSIQTRGRWIENKEVKIITADLTGLKVEQSRKVYFDGHDLYIRFKNNRYYYSEFELIE